MVVVLYLQMRRRAEASRWLIDVHVLDLSLKQDSNGTSELELHAWGILLSREARIMFTIVAPMVAMRISRVGTGTEKKLMFTAGHSSKHLSVVMINSREN